VDSDQVTVWSTTQTPFNVRAQLAEIFRRSESRIRIIVPTLGGGFGGKCYPKLEPVTAVLAQAAGRPVRLHLPRREEFITVTKHGARIRIKTGVRRDGTIIARQCTCHFNTGAYADIGPRLIKNGGYASAGPYAIPNISIDSYAIYTNLPPAGAFRGYGVNQAAWAYESQMDLIADRIGLDPYELRRRNLLRDGESLMTGEPMRGSHLHELLDDVAQWIGWGSQSPDVPPGHVRGKGLACVIKSTVTPSTSSAELQVQAAGPIRVLTSSVEMGQGVSTAVAKMAADRLGVPVQNVQVSTPDTDLTPYDQQTSSSRSTHSMGTALVLAADDLERQLKQRGAELLEVAPEDVVVARGAVAVRGAPNRKVTFADVARSEPASLIIGHGTFATLGGLDPETGQGVASIHWHQAAGAAEVDVDLDTGKVAILRYRAAVYAGRVVNRVLAELQTEGNVAFGVGQALFEELIFDDGQPVNGNLSDYMIASINDLPQELAVRLVEHPEEGEIHGLGETSLPPVMAAVGNAVYHATGVRVEDLPITPERLLRLLRDA
jgi:CO/xanthine dehydrogenase Mo-binding subunit